VSGVTFHRMNVRSVNKGRGKAAAKQARKPRGRPLTDDKRRRILDAALKLFAVRGYHGTAIPDVATAAKVSIGTLYHYFEHKQQLVNEVYRDAKVRIRGILLDDLPAPDLENRETARAWFDAIWLRLMKYAHTDPEGIRFLEMQDHIEYLDQESRHVEMSVLAPLWFTGKQLRDKIGGPPIDTTIAMMWGAFVALVKYNRIGYLRLDDASMEEAGATCWRMIGPDPSPPPKRGRRA
jgi:AcrR family transcriptional regulator